MIDIKNTILAGDTGGTKTLLSLYQEQDGERVEIKTSHYSSNDFSSLEAIIQDFLQDCTGIPMAAAFGIPGPVIDGYVKSTNLPWTLDERELSKQTGIPRVKLVNDLVATAYSLPELTPSELFNIKPGKTPKDPQRYVVLAPGTGLGQSFLVRQNGKTIVIPSEGGHADFAPTNNLEVEVCQFLLNRFGHVSYERIISGKGIPNLFDFLIEAKKMQPEAETLEQMKTRDKATVISEMALKQKDAVCVEAMDIFVSILGANAGNLALSFLADGGIYLAGGIPFKILPKLIDGSFVRNFLNKGRLQWLLDPIPVNVITNNRAALKGSAQIAFEINK